MTAYFSITTEARYQIAIIAGTEGVELPKYVRQHFNYDVPALIGAVKRLAAELVQALEAHGRTVDGVMAAGWERAADEMADQQDEAPMDECPVCGAPTGGRPCANNGSLTPAGTPTCADLVAEAVTAR